MTDLNKLLPENKKNIDPLEQITEMYHNHIKVLASKIEECKAAGRDPSFLEMKQSEALGAVIALGKVRELQYYLKNYDMVTMAERRKIMRNTSTII